MAAAAANGGSASGSYAAGGASPSSGSTVSRRIGNMFSSAMRGSTTRVKPSLRRTIDSHGSTGSTAEFATPEQTIILFDWDDTLCPSTWIREHRPELSFFKPAPKEDRFQKPLAALSKEVRVVLEMALQLGKVVIVTNAMEPWVETSCRNFLPELMPIVEKIPVVYARSVYEQFGCDRTSAAAKGKAMPGMYSANGVNKLTGVNAKLRSQGDEMAPQRWKELAFQQEIAGFYTRYSHQSWKNVISIGDSIFERDAARIVVLRRPSEKKKCHTKTAKLLDEPSMEELIAQVKILHGALNLMVQYDGNLDIEIDEDDLKMDLSIHDKILDR